MGFPATIENDPWRQRQITSIDKQALAVDGRRQHSTATDIDALRRSGPAARDSGLAYTKRAQQQMHPSAYHAAVQPPALFIRAPGSVYALPVMFEISGVTN
jgi:hypothetical protein